MKKNIAILLSVIMLLSLTALFSCKGQTDDTPQSEPENTDDLPVHSYTPPAYDAEGNYLGFSDITEGYTPEDAVADGCLVIDNKNGKNEYGATVIEETKTFGYEKWEHFWELSQSGENAFIRVAHFIDGVGYYFDLHYCDGKYILFNNNELGIYKECEFKYLRYLDKVNENGIAYLFILTDSLELTYEEVSRSMVASSTSQMTKIPYKWVGFMTWFNDEVTQSERFGMQS